MTASQALLRRPGTAESPRFRFRCRRAPAAPRSRRLLSASVAVEQPRMSTVWKWAAGHRQAVRSDRGRHPAGVLREGPLRQVLRRRGGSDNGVREGLRRLPGRRSTCRCTGRPAPGESWRGLTRWRHVALADRGGVPRPRARRRPRRAARRRRRSPRPTSADALARRRLGLRPRRPDEVRAGRGRRSSAASGTACTLGGPVAIQVGNTEWPKWETGDGAPTRSTREVLAGLARNAPLTRPRPGHADLAGMQKYGFDDARPVLERASARETAARVALGAVAQRASSGRRSASTIVSHVVAHRRGRARPTASMPGARRPRRARRATRCAASTRPPARRWSPRSTRPRRTATPSAASSRCSSYGLPPGLGSHVHWDRRLDSRLAGALMGIQAIKGVEVGDGFEPRRAPRLAGARRDRARTGRACRRRTGRAGGIEGGMTNGEVLRVRAAMKPISTVPRALATIDVRPARPPRPSTSAPTSARCRPPGSSPRRWSRWCWPTRCWRSSAATRSTETPAQPATWRYLATTLGRPRGESAMSVGPGRRAGRPAGFGQVDRRRGCWPSGSGVRVPRHRRATSRHGRASRSPTSSSTTARRASASWSAAAVAAALAEHDGVLALGGGAVLTRRPARLLAGHTGGLPRRRPRRRRRKRVGLAGAGRCCWATRAPADCS